MHWIQHEHPDVYHVVRWENSAFHNHESTVHNRRKLPGGVSFDQGAVSGGQSHTKAPASFSMPVSVSSNENNISGIGLGIERGNTTDASKGKRTDKNAKTDHNEKTGKNAIAEKYEMTVQDMVAINVSDTIRETLSGARGEKLKKAISLISAFYRKVRYPLHADHRNTIPNMRSL